MQKIIAVIGARPQFIKHAPIEIAAKGKLELISIHTGQHYDAQMSSIFFDQLNMATPKYHLDIGSHSHGVQTGRMMEKIEPIVIAEKPDAILVYGDTNSTLAGALVASKLNIPVIHIEAGLRSFNKEMPEEINRILTDHISCLLFVPTDTAVTNLAKEGITTNVFKTGDVMCDMVNIALAYLQKDLTEKAVPFYYATIHRPYNTDDIDRLKYVLSSLNKLSLTVKLALHPRTRNRMKQMGLLENEFPNIHFLPPLGYFENINYQYQSSGIITDSGGIQKEAYILKKQCITIRKETEWVETLKSGWNTLVFKNLSSLEVIFETVPKHHEAGIYGDGHSAHDIINKIISNLL